MEVSEAVPEPARGGVFKSTSRRVRMIFSVMASPNRIDILRILNSKGPLTYSELKSLAGFKSKKESGKFAYHLRKLLRQSLVALNRSEKRYTITNLGKLVLSLARQIEDRSLMESGKMYVRTSRETIEEMNPDKILQSLVREAGIPLELAQKIAEEVEGRIYKYQPTYLTGSLIREVANAILMEHGHEEYRNKMARMGMPAHDVLESVSGAGPLDGGADGLLHRAGRAVFAEHLLSISLPKDVADAHMSGDLHISDPGCWSVLPDTVLVDARELLPADGVDLGGKLPGVSRARPAGTLDELGAALSAAISLLSREASREAVVDGLPQALARHARDAPALRSKVAAALAAASAATGHGRAPALVTLRVRLGGDAKAAAAVLAAYKEYARITPAPGIGIAVDSERGRVADVSAELAEIALLGGRIMVSKRGVTCSGVAHAAAKGAMPVIGLQSVTVNLPRLALESNRDETYFRARLALLMRPALAAMELRRRDISDVVRRGLNPLLARGTEYMQRGSVALTVNLVGLREAVFGILGYEDGRAGRDVMYKVAEAAAHEAAKKAKETGADVRVSLTESDGAARLAAMDGEKYGKGAAGRDPGPYSEGLALDAGAEYTARSEAVAECGRLSGTLTGGVLAGLDLSGLGRAEAAKAIERAASLVPSFRPYARVPVCGECGRKAAAGAEKCPKCKSPHLI